MKQNTDPIHSSSRHQKTTMPYTVRHPSFTFDYEGAPGNWLRKKSGPTQLSPNRNWSKPFRSNKKKTKEGEKRKKEGKKKRVFVTFLFFIFRCIVLFWIIVKKKKEKKKEEERKERGEKGEKQKEAFFFFCYFISFLKRRKFSRLTSSSAQRIPPRGSLVSSPGSLRSR